MWLDKTVVGDSSDDEVDSGAVVGGADSGNLDPAEASLPVKRVEKSQRHSQLCHYEVLDDKKTKV